MNYQFSTAPILGIIAMTAVCLAAFVVFRRYRKFKKRYKDDFEGWI